MRRACRFPRAGRIRTQSGWGIRVASALDGARIAEEIRAEPERLFSDMPAAVRAEAAGALAGYLPRLKSQVQNIVVRCARLGKRPDWGGPDGVREVPVVKPMMARNGGGQPLGFVMRERVEKTVDQ